MPNSWPIALAIIVAVVAAWDHARRWLTLQHGLMLTKDRSQVFDRALTQLELRVKRTDTDVAELLALKSYAHGLGDQLAGIKANIDALAESVKQSDIVLDGRAQQADSLQKKIDFLYDWTGKAESTFEKLSADIDTRDRAITNVAEELVVLKQQQTMALAGVANLPKHGFAGRPKT